MSRRVVAYALFALFAAGVAWFFNTFERIAVTERMGMRSRELRSLPELDSLRPGVLLMPNRRQAIDADRVVRLLAWVQAGGHLIAEAELPGVNDPLLDALHLTRAQLTDKLVSLPRGKGMVSVAASLNFARNQSIGANDHAERFWQLLQLTPAQEVQVFFRPERLSLSRFLVEHALAAIISAGLLLALWLWRIAPRFGPVTPDAPPARRRLLDHLRASGRYYWSQGLRAPLVLAARDAALRRIARSQPDFGAASGTEKQRRLTALAGMSPEEAAQFLAAGGSVRGADFIRIVQRAQRVHSALDKGGR